MLETLVHYSKHRWTVLKLPPRRIERRLTAAAHWFAEMIERRDPFAVIHLRSRTLQPLRDHPRWPELAAKMRLET